MTDKQILESGWRKALFLYLAENPELNLQKLADKIDLDLRTLRRFMYHEKPLRLKCLNRIQRFLKRNHYLT